MDRLDVTKDFESDSMVVTEDFEEESEDSLSNPASSILISNSTQSSNSISSSSSISSSLPFMSSVMIVLMKISKGMTNESVNVFLKFFLSMYPDFCCPTSVRSCLRTISSRCDIKKHFVQCENVFRLDIIFQLRMIMRNNINAFLDYRQSLLSSGNIDLISTSPYIGERNPFVIHAMLCADGTNMFSTKSDSFWPLQVVLLDFPLHVRQKIHNRILLSFSTAKPKWSDILSTIHEDFSQSFSLIINNVTYNFELKLFKCIFDLPGLASICNVTQYNGEYGCPYCLHPGVQIAVGHGSSRKYPFVSDIPLRTDHHYRDCLTSVSETGRKVFGVKGPSPLFQILKYPDDVVFDSMHAFYEGVAKQFLMFSTTMSVIRHPLKFASRSKLNFVNNFVASVLVPHEFSKFPSLDHVKMMKASELKSFLLYLFVPIYFAVTPIPICEHVLLLVYIIRLSCASCIDDEVCCLISRLVSAYFTKAGNLLPKEFFSLNLHFLLHLEKQLQSSGPLQTCSMFSFEAGMKHFKKLCHGTTHHGKQIVVNFLLYKFLFFEVFSHRNQYSRFSSVLKDIAIDVDNSNGFISTDRYRINGVMYHSTNYARKGKSASNLCFLKNGDFAEILSFHKNTRRNDC